MLKAPKAILEEALEVIKVLEDGKFCANRFCSECPLYEEKRCKMTDVIGELTILKEYGGVVK